jgi:hypothetical protein
MQTLYNGETVTIRETQGIEGENAVMEQFALQLIEEACALGVSKESIHLYRANIAEDNSYAGLTPIIK